MGGGPEARINLLAVGRERVGEIAVLHAELFDPAWDAPSIAGLMGEPGSIALLAVTRTEAVGFLLARRAADEAEILSIGVRPDMQRHGLGRRLLDTLAAELRDGGATHRLFLEVSADNATALALYRSVGFREVGRRPRYYQRPDGSADALILALAIQGSLSGPERCRG